jgi:hypothetical protein
MLPDPRLDATDATREKGADRHPEAAGLPITLAKALAELAAILPGLKAALDRQADARPRIEPLAYRLDELADALGVSRRAIERERSAGRFPRPDLTIGKMPLWRPETVRSFLERGGR